MKKLNTSPISGMQELLPSEQATFNRLKSGIESVYHLHGYQNIETPIIDRTEILLAKAGGDTEKQIYKVVKTAETAADADQALRFDHTVPLARYVVEHQNDLAFPFKVTQVGRNFRGERAQKGRYREFYQCDIDVIGRGQLSLAYDADIIATLADALQVFNLPGLKIRLSNRQLLQGLLEEYNLNQLSAQIFNIVDHAEKIPPAQTKQSLLDLGLEESHIAKLIDFMHISGPDVIQQLRDLDIQNATFKQGITDLATVLAALRDQGLAAQPAEGTQPAIQLIPDMLIVRGLDYYTGTVFETFVTGHESLGSICSGGRYDQLASHYTDQPLPGVGGSIGLTRLFFVLREAGLLADSTASPIDFAIIPISEHEVPYAQQLATTLRDRTDQLFAVDIILTDKRLGDKLSHAAKIAKYGIVIGESEVQTGQVSAKNFTTGETVPLADILKSSV